MRLASSSRYLAFPLLCALAGCGARGLAPQSADTGANEFGHPLDRRADAPLAAMDEDGKRLRYGLYRDRGAARARNIVPDFSRAGYMGGGVALPARDSIPVRATIAPGDGGGDDYPRIQAAIDAVAALPADSRGLRGAVLLRRGRYTLSDTLAIRVGGVVLRGEGRGANGTVLRSAIAARQGRIVEVGDHEAAVPRAAQQPRRTAIAAAYVPVGAMRIEVASAAGYQAGDRIAVVREPNSAWTGAEGIDTARYGWQARDYAMHYERVVTAVRGNTLSLDASIVDAIDARFGGGHVYRIDPRRIAQAGIEDLRLEGDPDTGIARGTPDTGPYTAVRFAAVRDSWVRNVAVRYVSHGFATHNGAHFNTFEDLAYLDPRYGETEGVRRYVFVYEGNSAFNLTQRCYGEGGRHTFVTGARVPGPNVFLDCVAADANNDSGPHHRWATGTLYDNTRGGLLRAQNRRASGTGHGWAGAQQLFWNVEHPHYLVQAPPFAMNWAVGAAGATGAAKFPPEEPAGIVESAGRAVAPRSLYLQQLRDRLGEPAVDAVATAAQRQGRIWDSLSAQRGD
ncbi:hypothetical protein [Lysobacter enzymogenes]|uniref:Pectin lyase fold/virulence factor n=1 Tax=Lysobacter enzymogenes TaxID=69 RepID=G5D8X4_LYSEN|nr:hypothetical protein [Lysobacter enzymogenes]AEP18659.1 pectin lyase fold/virulence factor [Lysobacter enzymogenes]ROU07255.1 hypothetical protein D9T17_09825 [Lysobacter enzymogenes]